MRRRCDQRLLWAYVLVFLALLASLLAGTRVAWAESGDTSAVTSDEPQHGIPLLLVYVNESDAAIANANAADTSHTNRGHRLGSSHRLAGWPLSIALAPPDR